ncbi:MAG: HD-GYP domain-containing protein [Armatimonadetes bacterium]|nr:HD-GYP domain-containing protein [Armatimonadota bacterium]
MPRTLRALPARARLFFWIILGVSVCLLGVILFWQSSAAVLWETARTGTPIVIAASALIFLARLYPIPFAGGDRVSVTFRLDGVVLFAAILLLPEIEAVLVAVAGVGFHQLYVYFNKRERWYLCVFNTAQYVIVVGLAAIAYRALDNGTVPPLASPRDLIPILVTTAVYFAVNTALISTMLALVRQRRPWEVWVGAHRWTWHLYLAHLALGILIADLFLVVPLAVPLVTLMVLVLRHAYGSVAIIRDQTRETIELLADTVDRRDPYTFQHSQRVADYCRLIARRLEMSADEVDAIVQAARVHDVGKIAISDVILQKPGSLTDEERGEIDKHAAFGAEIVARLPQYQRGKEYILYHHERYDGSGTFRLRGRDIPVGARIIAAADTFDAMTSDRPYRRALDRAVAIAEMIRQKGKQLDPVVVEAFITALQEQELLSDAPRLGALVPQVPLPVPAAASTSVRH